MKYEDLFEKDERPKRPRKTSATGPKKLWDNYKEVGYVQKSEKIRLVLGAGIRDGVRYINIREFYLRKRDGIWKPGKDGITIPLKLPIKEATEILTPYTKLLEVLAITVETLESMELEDENNAVYAKGKEASNEEDKRTINE